MKFRERSEGTSLVELLVAVAVTVVVVACTYAGFSAHQRLFAQEQQILELQQNVRIALNTAAQVLQQAGYWRCVASQAVSTGTRGVKRTLKDSKSLFHTHPLMGFNNITESSDPFPDGQTQEGTDILGYSFIDPAFHGRLSQDQNLPRDFLRLVKNKDTRGLKKGQIVFLTDCRHSALFQATSVTLSGTEVMLEHDCGGLEPGNMTCCLRCDDGGSDCLHESECGLPGTGFRAETSHLHPVKAGFFRVNRKGEFQWLEGGPDATGRYVFSRSRTLAENVEDFQVEFGVNTSPVPNGDVDAWVSSDAMPQTAPGSGVKDWERVRAVRCHLLARTKRFFKGYVDTTLYAFADRNATVTADGYRRFYMVKTIGIRNATP
ncbi:PilW family protein [Desulfosoma caldarium]|uniref:Type IV pilus-assembly PilW-like protein n=1 Tax=Desulfosoma caldarium TaxID=610254 RepID=A0A3N1VNX6_9BACT|nr:PilW family protein [Desulfosoma caldarium]ROR01932.1 type IV pilus-assembly PilW-like protein [Desulfosoma caldarium]